MQTNPHHTNLTPILGEPDTTLCVLSLWCVCCSLTAAVKLLLVCHSGQSCNGAFLPSAQHHCLQTVLLLAWHQHTEYTYAGYTYQYTGSTYLARIHGKHLGRIHLCTRTSHVAVVHTYQHCPAMVYAQVSLVPALPVLPPQATTSLEVRFRPLLVGSSDATLKLDSTELGLYEWKLKLTGAATIPERPLVFSVPLGTREVQVST